MTLTLSEDCSSITIASERFNLLNTSNTLTITHYNGTTSTEYTIEIPAENTADYVIEPSDIDSTATAFADGTYEFSLVTIASDESSTTETSCLPVLCSVTCDMPALFTDITNVDKILAYEGLKAGVNCLSCSCSVLNELYAVLTDSSTNGCTTCSKS
jgi:hypothetical protein